jgi:hypothetical protein
MDEDFNPDIISSSSTDSLSGLQNISFNLHIINILNIDSSHGQVRNVLPQNILEIYPING